MITGTYWASFVSQIGNILFVPKSVQKAQCIEFCAGATSVPVRRWLNALDADIFVNIAKGTTDPVIENFNLLNLNNYFQISVSLSHNTVNNCQREY